jgi:hypothetical protein
MKSIYIVLLCLLTKAVFAHEPDLSNIMVYEQNGKYLLVMKSSLTAFEGEIDYNFKKNAYKTPEEFRQLVIKHFEKNCFVVINNDTVRFINQQVILGHETTLFAELAKTPQPIKSIYVKNSFFKDMTRNMCELILTTKGLSQKQYILNNDNKQEVKLIVENNNWMVEDGSNAIFNVIKYPLCTIVFLIVLIGALFQLNKYQLI